MPRISRESLRQVKVVIFSCEYVIHSDLGIAQTFLNDVSRNECAPLVGTLRKNLGDLKSQIELSKTEQEALTIQLEASQTREKSSQANMQVKVVEIQALRDQLRLSESKRENIESQVELLRARVLSESKIWQLALNKMDQHLAKEAARHQVLLDRISVEKVEIQRRLEFVLDQTGKKGARAHAISKSEELKPTIFERIFRRRIN
jgi:hypothetical protein